MNKLNGNIVFKLLFVFFALSVCNHGKGQEQIHLFPDKSYAVSGDTIWLGVFIHAENQDGISQVVHVQLDDLQKNHILKVSVLCEGAFGEGYIPIPDSLSTGVYALNAFSLQQKISESAVINQKFIHVYNRFSEEINSIWQPVTENLKIYTNENTIEIKTDKETYKRGENVQVSVNVPQDKTGKYQKIFVSAGITEPLSENYISSFRTTQTVANTETPVSLVEKNGVLISGRVTGMESSEPVSNAVVLLSIPDSVPFFDYCVSDEAGYFYFYLRNAVGTADLILQAITKDNLDCRIELVESFVEVQDIQTTEKILTYSEALFAEEIIKASYFDKFFTGYDISGTTYFSKPQQFKFPFYGEPTKTFDPNLFIDLPDFQEISREILYGVQYRERKDEITIRLIDYGSETIFEKEPLKLLDGIPVFNNEVFKPMGTANILKVEAVFFEQFYGDLSFPGVLSVYTKNRSLDWVDNDPRIGHFKFDCLQPPKKIEFINGRVPNTNIPNLNKVLYRNSLNNLDAVNEFNFFTSDITGDVNIRLMLIDENNQIHYCYKLIRVE